MTSSTPSSYPSAPSPVARRASPRRSARSRDPLRPLLDRSALPAPASAFRPPRTFHSDRTEELNTPVSHRRWRRFQVTSQGKGGSLRLFSLRPRRSLRRLRGVLSLPDRTPRVRARRTQGRLSTGVTTRDKPRPSPRCPGGGGIIPQPRKRADRGTGAAARRRGGSEVLVPVRKGSSPVLGEG